MNIKMGLKLALFGFIGTSGGGGCSSIDIKNSNNTYSDTITCEESPFTLPNINFTDTNGDVSVVPSVINVTATQIPDISDSDLIAQTTDQQVVALVEARLSYRIIEITTLGAGVYTTPSDVVYADVIGIGGGGGGGSGRLGNTSLNRTGGTAGGCGGFTRLRLTKLQLGVSQNYFVGAGGAGGAGQTGATQLNGIAGSVGEDTTFGAYLLAFGGSAGIGGTSSTNTGNTPTTQTAPNNTPSVGGNCYGNTGSLAATNATGQSSVATALGSTTSIRFPNGGSGGGLNTSNNETAGGGGGRWFNDVSGWVAAPAAGTAGGGDGTDGTSNVWTTIGMEGIGGTIGVGISGAGGGSGQDVISGRGGDGGLYGGSGAGGGGGRTTVGTQRGGNGGQGCLVIIEYYIN